MHPFIQRLNEILTAARDGRLNGYSPLNRKCVYRTEHGTGCAIGVLLTENELTDIEENGLNEGTSYSMLIATYPRITERLGITRAEGSQLQSLHDELFDSNDPVSTKRARFIDLAERLLRGEKISIPGIHCLHLKHENSAMEMHHNIDINTTNFKIKPEVLAA